MNTRRVSRHALLGMAVSSVLLAACTATTPKSEDAERLRVRLTQLQSNSELAKYVPLALQDAEIAVKNAEQKQTDPAVAAHLVFIADRKINIAWAQGESLLAVDQRKLLSEQREAARLQARTREADTANDRATAAERDASNQTLEAQAAWSDTADAERTARELQQQIDEMNAKVTERGLVLTLGDVLFSSGAAQLNVGANANLGKLAHFLNTYPKRTAAIEGHTDNIGNDGNNQALSQRRADAVKSHLVGREGIDARRLTAFGKGEGSPVADNSSPEGRQQNRRVEVIIAELPAQTTRQEVQKYPVTKQTAESGLRQ